MLPHAAILGATLMWASAFAAGRLAVATMPPSEILMFRFAIGAVLLWLRATAASAAHRPAVELPSVTFADLTEPSAASAALVAGADG